MSRQSPLGSSGTWLYMLPTRAHSMLSGNNNTSYRLTAYLCKNPARGGIWNALVLFFEISSFRYVPLAVVMFSLPYQFSGDGKFYYRAYLVCHTQMPSLHVALERGHRNSSLKCSFFFPASVTVCMCSLCSTPGKEERHVFIKKIRKQGVGKWQISRSLLLEYIDCAWFIDFLLQEVAQLSANREEFVSAICFGTFEADHLCTPCVQYVHRFCVRVSNVFFLFWFSLFSGCMCGSVCRRCSCKIGR